MFRIIPIIPVGFLPLITFSARLQWARVHGAHIIFCGIVKPHIGSSGAYAKAAAVKFHTSFVWGDLFDHWILLKGGEVAAFDGLEQGFFILSNELEYVLLLSTVIAGRNEGEEYYRIPFSAGVNAQEETAYSIGKITKRRLPAGLGSSSNEALENGRKPSGAIIYSSEAKSQEVKTALQLAYEKALKQKGDKAEASQEATATNEVGMEVDAKTESVAPAVLKSERDMVKQDRAYLDAVNRGDMETAQKMADEAAKEAGFPVRLLHGTQKFGFTVADTSLSDDKLSFFATSDVDTAKTYSSLGGKRGISEDADYDSIDEESASHEENARDMASSLADEISRWVGYCWGIWWLDCIQHPKGY